MKQPVFLTAEWRKLIVANYLTDPSILKKYIPYKTELDDWNGNHYISLVGFMFLNTKVLGIPFPYHRNFDEINLRFYVRYKNNGAWRQAAVFIKEIVSKRIVSLIANTFYGENYVTMPVKNEFVRKEKHFELKYKFGNNKCENFLYAKAQNDEVAIPENSIEEFIIDKHFWGYTKCGETKTSEYEVEHAKWTLYKTLDSKINVDVKQIYGEEFVDVLSKPDSILMSEGSKILVRKGKFI